jgi:hypothetical protein
MMEASISSAFLHVISRIARLFCSCIHINYLWLLWLRQNMIDKGTSIQRTFNVAFIIKHLQIAWGVPANGICNGVCGVVGGFCDGIHAVFGSRAPNKVFKYMSLSAQSQCRKSSTRIFCFHLAFMLCV